MRIRSITVQGFRGFNEERTIDFHDRLTLICAPNSYGKTSISEAVEWLLYGITSKVEKADSKDEYKGSYRNSHLPDSKAAFVKATFVDGSSETQFRGDLLEGDDIGRSVNGKEVERWPFLQDLSAAPQPFVLQHALKHLLLVKPDERFQGFARLLGLEELDEIHQSVISLCTKPDAAIPSEVKQLRQGIEALEDRVADQASLASIAKSFKKGKKGLDATRDAIAEECRLRVPPDTDDQSVLPQLLKIRDDAVEQIFERRITLPGYSAQEKQTNADDEHFVLGYLTAAFVQKYTGLIALATVQHILDRAHFFHLGVKLLEDTPGECPFCGQPVGDAVAQHIREQHESLGREKQCNLALEGRRSEVVKSVTALRDRLGAYHNRHIGKSASLLALRPSLPKLKTILLPKHEAHFSAVETAISELTSAKQKLEGSYGAVVAALHDVDTSITQSKEGDALLTALGGAVVKYVADAHSFVQVVSNNVGPASDADQILKHELDALAGTEDISVLVDLLERRSDIEKKFEIDGVLEGLKELRKAADQYVGNKVLAAISGELTSEVMKWYGQIKTKGDPDVHFAGFDIERTTKGALKARRVQIKATSYGKDLVSAVSSLSESKLNALGLCVSIATNLKGDSPFDFLIIDDPIQSWDAEHEIQFIEVVRKLVERGKQVILLSHNGTWVNQVRSGCRTLNGWYYEITSYTKAGPLISEVPWEVWSERLKEVDAILKDPDASTVKLQQAEQEIRIVVAQLTCEVYRKTKGVSKSPHDLNSTKVRKMLVECGVRADLVDRIRQTFDTTDPAHHASENYAPDRQRIRVYYDWAHELAQLLS